MLILKNINKSFSIQNREKVLFEGLNLQVEKGQFVCLLGSNGSGKTTLLNLVCGNISPDSGNIFLNGQEITNDKAYKRARKIGRVFQNPSMGICADMTVFENLSLANNKNKGYGLRFCVDRRKRDYFQTKLESFGMDLENSLYVKAGNLSGGQKQALALLIATMEDIELLILDEHTAALDPSASNTIMEITGNIIRDSKITALMVTHDLEYALNYGDRLIMMHRGSVIMDKEGIEKSRLDVAAMQNYFDGLNYPAAV